LRFKKIRWFHQSVGQKKITNSSSGEKKPTDGEIPKNKQQIPKPRMIMIRGWFGILGLRIDDYLGFEV